MIKRILHSWSFHMKFIERAFSEFNKFHMKIQMTLYFCDDDNGDENHDIEKNLFL